VARFEGKSTLYTWLFRIAMNLAISHRRASQYRATVSLDGGREEEEGTGSGVNRQAAGLQRQLTQETEDDPAITAERQMEYEKLQMALARLDPEFKAVIVLRDVEECDYDQMAEILNVPVGTVKSRLFRARLALRELLQGKADSAA
jgi:RNA polymerase sigma-70 factor (ECF subfamily)